jgi:hypothetical protein
MNFIINAQAQSIPVKKISRKIIQEVMFKILSAKQLWGRSGRIIKYN